MQLLDRYLIFLLCALSQLAQAQLVTPTDLPSTSANFRLRAHSGAGNSTLATSIENWVLATWGESECNQFGSLVSEEGGDGEAGQVLFVNVESRTIQSEQEGKRSILTLEKDGSEKKVLKLECGEEALSQVGIRFRDSVPVLALGRDVDSQFHACQDTTGTVSVFYREAHSEALQSGCVDIDLLLECAPGPDHGVTELAACCTRVHNGDCLQK